MNQLTDKLQFLCLFHSDAISISTLMARTSRERKDKSTPCVPEFGTGRDLFGDATVVGDGRWAGSWGVSADFTVMTGQPLS